jgi:hypothetical protein
MACCGSDSFTTSGSSGTKAEPCSRELTTGFNMNPFGTGGAREGAVTDSQRRLTSAFEPGSTLLVSQNGFDSLGVTLFQSSFHAQTQAIAPYCRYGNRSAISTIDRARIVFFQVASYFTGIP